MQVDDEGYQIIIAGLIKDWQALSDDISALTHHPIL